MVLVSKRCVSLLAAGTVFVAGGFAQAQQPSHSATSNAAVPAGRSQPGRTSVGPPRSVHTGHAGFHANAQNGVQDSGVPRPTWELPRTVTPEWEIPNYNPVQPNQVQGNPRDHGSFGGPLGGFVGYGVFPGYSFIEPSASDEQAAQDDAGSSAQPGGPGPAGYPPDYPGRDDSGRQFSGRAGFPPRPGPAQAEDSQFEQGFIAPRRPPYRPQGNAQTASSAQSATEISDGLEHPEITLLFHDGRPPLKIRSYVLTGSALVAIENGRQTRIPLADLDLPATEQRNREAGADFIVPGGTR